MTKNEIMNPLIDEKFARYLDFVPEAIIVVNKDSGIEMVNQLSEEMFGYSRNEILEQKLEFIIPHCQTQQTHEGREFSGLKKGGSEFPVEISCGPLPIDHDKRTICIVRDTTARKKIEAKFQSLLESAPDGIVVVDTNGLIVIVNTEVERLFNYTKIELIGQSVDVLVPDRFKNSHVKDRKGYMANPHTRPMGAGRLLSGRKKNGVEFPVEISLSPLETEQGMLVTAIVRDITERRQFEETIKASLYEKEVLLKEIHHRVKNNLQITSSLLRLQSDYIKDEHVKSLFAEGQNRILSMALIHEKLYQSSDLSKIKLLDYIDGLSQLLFRSYGVNADKIKLHIAGDPVFLTVDAAIPCGLMINELISNCLKHAFLGRNEGEIQINVKEDVNKVVSLTIIDNGIGLPAGFNFEKNTSLGLQLVKSLVKQLNGEIEIKTVGGVEFKISFAEDATKK